jgi:hypothetical protein
MAGFTVLTGRNDFKKLALSTLTWLPDGQHGWLYGVNGLIATTDAGKTWASVYQSSQLDSTINKLVFSDPLNGVATLGDFHLPPFYQTTDGGKSWTKTYTAPFAYRSVDISYAGGQYRALIIDPFQVSKNTYMVFSTDGQKWTLKDKTFYGKIARGQTEMTNMLWDGDNTGYMALRSCEIWRTGDGGLTWASVHDAEDTTNGSIYKVLTGSMNADSAYGQTTILLGTGDNATLAQFVTGKSTGELQYYQPYPVFTFPASVPTPEFSVTRLNAVAYPNPTRSEAEIGFHMQTAAAVRVELVNELGQRVLTQNLGAMEPGNRSAHLDLTGLPAGLYRYTVVVGDARESGGLTVTR